MPTVKVPLFTPVYRNVEGEEASDTTWQLIDGYTDELGYSRRRPGLEFFCDLSTTDPIPEPASSGPILEDNFEGTVAPWWTEATVNAALYLTEDPITADAAHSGSYGANYHIAVGTVSDTEPLKLTLYPSADPTKDIYTLLGSRRELYFEWYEFFTTGYPWPTTSQKIFQVGYFDANEPGTPVGDQSENWEVMLTIHGDSDTIVNQFYQVDFSNANATGTFWTLTNDSTPTAPIRDENVWVKCGVHVKLNSGVGVSDGFVKLYLDDVSTLTYVALPYLWAGDINAMPLADAGVVNHPINSISIGLNWSNPTGASAANGNRYFDDIKIYGTKP